MLYVILNLDCEDLTIDNIGHRTRDKLLPRR